MKTINKEECETIGYTVDDNDICAISPNKDQITCNGDSGSPVVTDIWGSYYLIGIVAAGQKFCPRYGVSILQSFPHVKMWIDEYLKGYTCDPHYTATKSTATSPPSSLNIKSHQTTEPKYEKSNHYENKYFINHNYHNNINHFYTANHGTYT